MKRLTWVFELMDRMSGPAKAASSAVGEIHNQVERVGGSEGIGNLTSGLAGAITVAGLVEKAFEKVVDVIAEAGRKVVDMSLEMSKFALESASFKESTMVSLETVLGSAQKANSLYASTVQLADRLPIQTKQAVEIETRFALAGFKDQATLQRLLVGAADVKALRGDEGVQGFVRQMSDIAAVGLSDRHLMYLSQEAGIPENLIFDQLRKLSGRQGSDEQIKKLVSQGAFDRGTGETAVLQALAQVQGGQLGNLSGKLGQTFEGLMSTLKSRKLEFFQDIVGTQGFASVKGALSNLVNLFDPSSTFGAALKKRALATFGGAFQNLFGDLSGPGGSERLENGLTQVFNIADKLFSLVVFGASMGKEALFGFFDALGITGGIFTSGGALDPAAARMFAAEAHKIGEEFGYVAKFLGDLAELFERIAGYVGVVSDFVDKIPGLSGALHQLINPAGAAIDTLGEVEKDSQKYTGHSLVDNAATPLAAAALGPVGQVGVTLYQTFNVDGGDHKDARELAEHMKDQGSSALDAVLAQLGLGAGSHT